VTSRLSGLRGRAIATAKGHHFIVDSPLTLGGPNEEINPIDLFLASLATHATFICERIAQEAGIPLASIAITVTGDFDPRAVRGEPVEPQLQALKLRLNLVGPSEAQAYTLVEAVRTRCLIYTTLVRAVPIEMETIVEGLSVIPTADLPPSQTRPNLNERAS
jgi:uncharacterized OsmC-like protein